MTKVRNARMLKQAIIQTWRQNVERIALFQAAVAVKLGLSAADNSCLQLLLRQGAQTAGELAEQVGLTTGAITGVVDRLERLGYASRESDPDDRRVVVVSPVYDKAGADTDTVFKGIANAISRLLDGYSNAQLRTMLEFMTQADEIFGQETQFLRLDSVAAA